MKLAAIALFALLAYACTAQVPSYICGNIPFVQTVAPGNYTGLMWNYNSPSTKFTLNCYQSWFNHSGPLIRTSTYVYCGAPSYTQGAHILLGQLPSSFANGSMSFTCPVAATFFVVTYNEGATPATFTFHASAQTLDGDDMVGKMEASLL